MALQIVNEKYNGQNALIANAGDWVDGELNFSCRFYRGSGTSNKVTWHTQGSNYWFTSQVGDWGEQGFLAGDTITVSYVFTGIPITAFQNQSQTFTILYITGNEMYVDHAFLMNPVNTFQPTFEHIDGRDFPTDNYVTGIAMLVDKAPASIDFEFNLTPSGSSLLNSLIDNELNRFQYDSVAGMTAGVPVSMTQLANKSGGLIKDVELTLVSTALGGWRNYKITYKFIQWCFLQDGIEPPNYYDTSDCVAPICRVKAFAEYGNPNGVQTDTSENIEANTGFFDENYNGVLSLYANQNTTWIDSLGDPIDKLDNSGKSTFTAIIEAPNQVNPTSTYRIGLIWRPINSAYYANKVTTNLGENLLLLAPEIDFIADGTTDPTIYQGFEDENGARWDFQNIKFEITGVDELTVSGDVIPNAEATSLFAGVPSGGRKSTIWISLGDQASDGTLLSKRVSLRIFDEDNYDAPTKGVQIPNVLDEVLLDHAGNDITIPLPQTTTEDDVLYRSNFQLIAGVQYEGVRARIHAYNTVTEESFTLEDIFFSFSSVPQISGIFQPNFITQRGFNLPPLSDRNHISLVRNPSLDAGALYALTLEYGYLSRWQYWLSQLNVDNDFFDIAEPFNGKNKNWQKFSNSGDWVVRISYYTRLDGVDDFNDQEVGIRPYEDDPTLSTQWDIEVLSTGATPTNLVNNELHEITATLTWTIGSFTNSWAEMTVEDFESGNRWVISSVLDQGGIANNPLKPIAGQTKLDMQFPSANIAVLKAYLDTNVISANKVCVSSRIYSEDVPFPLAWEWLVTNEKDAVVAYSVARKLSPDNIYSGALIRVRRSSDNMEMDIPYILIGSEYVLDEVFLLDFTGRTVTDFGYIVKRYDQSSAGNDNYQYVLINQPLIVYEGAVAIDTITGRPAMYCDGINNYMLIQNQLNNNTILFFASVFNRPLVGSSGVRASIGFGCLPPNGFTYSFQWLANLASFGILYDGLQSGAPSNIHFTGNIQTGAQLNLTWREVSNDIFMRLNGVSGTTLNRPIDNAFKITTTERVGNRMHEGLKSEDVMYSTDRVKTATQIEDNINNFYTIY